MFHIIVLFVAITFQGAASCIPSYNQILYEEWGCRPTTVKGQNCPSSFTCSRLWNRPNNTCFVSGKIYKKDNEIKADGIKGTCRDSCRCSEGFTGTYEPICAFPLCLGPPNETCSPTFSKIDQCCTGWSCPPTPTCNVSGQTYYDGEKFFPSECKTCLCTKKRVTCQRTKCLPELNYMTEINNKCAPVYGKSDCCPNSFKCPAKEDIIIGNLNNSGVSTKCYYGNSTLSLNSIVINTQENIVCTCNQPPLLTCFYL